MNDIPLGLITALVSIILGLISVLALSFLIFERRHAARYNDQRQFAELEMMRRSTETKIYELTDRLMATEARWRDTNHLLLDSQRYQQRGTSDEPSADSFLSNAGIDSKQVGQDPKLVLVLMPFHPDFRDTYETIRDVCGNLGLQAVRGDEEYVPSDILRHVLGLIVKARLVVAVVDGRNPNVFYELGIAHAMNKPTILVSARTSIEDLPFDVRSRRVVLAENANALADQLAPEIARALIER